MKINYYLADVEVGIMEDYKTYAGDCGCLIDDVCYTIHGVDYCKDCAREIAIEEIRKEKVKDGIDLNNLEFEFEDEFEDEIKEFLDWHENVIEDIPF